MVSPTPRRGTDDVFLIGEEQILADPEGADTDPIAIGSGGTDPARRPARSLHLPGPLQGARGLALAGLGAGALALLAALRPGGGQGPVRPHPTSSPRAPLISRSAARVPARPPARAHPRAPRPAEVPPPRAVHYHRSRRPEVPARNAIPVTAGEPAREPTRQEAPVSPPAVTETVPTPAPEAPAATATPAPPGPPPPSSGGGPAGVESFGFER